MQSKQDERDRKKSKKHKSKKRNRDDTNGHDKVNRFFDDEAQEGTDSGDEGHHSNKVMAKDQYYSKE